MSKRRKVEFGTVSHGTLRPEDLIPAFADELRRLRGALPLYIAKQLREFNAAMTAGQDAADEMGVELVQALEDGLQQYAPAYGYFGAHPGNGSDFGFWLCDDWQDLFDGLQVADTAEVPKGYRGEVLHVNDHGNATLYVATSRGLREVWAIV